MIQADARHIPLADESVQCVVTSPPYWGLRDYGIAPSIWGGLEDCRHEWGDEQIKDNHSGNHLNAGLRERDPGGRGGTQNQQNQPIEINQGSFCLHCHAWRGVLGLEPTPELYVEHMVEVFREIRRVLRKDGSVWLNLGDSYATQRNDHEGGGFAEAWGDRKVSKPRPGTAPKKGWHGGDNLKPKDLCGIPWRVAFALQADGWWLRSDVIEEVELYCPCGCGYVMQERIWRYSQDRDIIWKKPNPMPESVTDRPTKSHEYIFLLAKSESYYYDMDAIREPCIPDPRDKFWGTTNGSRHDHQHDKERGMMQYQLKNKAL